MTKRRALPIELVRKGRRTLIRASWEYPRWEIGKAEVLWRWLSDERTTRARWARTYLNEHEKEVTTGALTPQELAVWRKFAFAVTDMRTEGPMKILSTWDRRRR